MGEHAPKIKTWCEIYTSIISNKVRTIDVAIKNTPYEAKNNSQTN